MRKSTIFWVVVAIWMTFFIMMALAGCGEDTITGVSTETNSKYSQNISLYQIYTYKQDTIGILIFKEDCNVDSLNYSTYFGFSTEPKFKYLNNNVYTTVAFYYEQKFICPNDDVYMSYWVIDSNYLTVRGSDSKQGYIQLECENTYSVENYITLGN